MVRVLKDHIGPVRSVAWSPTANTLASGGHDGTILLCNSEGERTGRRLRHAGPVVALAWSPDGQTLASASDDNCVVLWGAKEGESKVLTHDKKVKAVAWNPDGTELVSGGEDGILRFWSKDGTPAGTLDSNKSLRAVNWLPDVPLLPGPASARFPTGNTSVTLSDAGEVVDGRPDDLDDGYVVSEEQSNGGPRLRKPSEFYRQLSRTAGSKGEGQ